MAIPEHIVTDLLTKCGRHCCICRRFRPVQLQVHHIVEQADGGTDDFDNLIALCLTCHSDVHTTRPFTRRFTPNELKEHRDRVISLVGEGRLIPSDDSIENDRHILQAVRETENCDLCEPARELLVAAAGSNGPIMVSKHFHGVAIRAGSLGKDVAPGREAAHYSAAVDELEEAGFVRACGIEGDVWEVTYSGYLKADELMALADKNNGKAVDHSNTTKKVATNHIAQ